MKITLLLDNPNSWMLPYARLLEKSLQECGHMVTWCNKAADMPTGDCAFFLSCEEIVSEKIRERNQHNIVIHASALPKGKGWSPMTWQILEGKNEIPLTLFEAEDQVDSGTIYLTDAVSLEGHELIDEMRALLGKKIIALALRFIEEYPPKKSKPQTGKESFYPRRGKKDSELDPQKTIAEQFNLLRVADNERYPCFFRIHNKKYLIKIYKQGEK